MPWLLAIALMGAGSAVAALPTPTPAPVEIVFSAGRVNVHASDARVSDVLAVWAKTGHSELVGAEYLGARTLTLHLTNTAEADALRAIVGMSSWYTTVAREAADASESTLRRIVILPAAASAAAVVPGSEPESRFNYGDHPDMAAAAAALLAQRTEPQPGQRSTRGEPESVYEYAGIPDMPDTLGILPPAGGEARQPAFPRNGLEPEQIYSYTELPDLPEGFSLARATFIGPPPTEIPEVRYTYDTPAPDSQFATLANPRARPFDVPVLPVILGLPGRIPGKMIRYVIGG